jgi:hypothetical protein
MKLKKIVPTECDWGQYCDYSSGRKVVYMAYRVRYNLRREEVKGDIKWYLCKDCGEHMKNRDPQYGDIHSVVLFKKPRYFKCTCTGLILCKGHLSDAKEFITF